MISCKIEGAIEEKRRYEWLSGIDRSEKTVRTTRKEYI